MYGIMIAIGILFAFGVLFFYGKKASVDAKFLDFVFYDGLISIAVGFGFAALFQAIYNYIKNPSAGFHVGEGITFIGGLIGGVACCLVIYYFCRKKYNNSLLDVLSLLPCCIVLAHGFGRIGCFFAGCCYARETDCFLGVKFPGMPNPVHPTQLYEATFLFLLFALFSYLLLKKKYKYNMPLYLILYGTFRFLLEFIRGDERGRLIGIFSPSQFWSVLMIIGGMVFYMVFFRLLKNKEVSTV
ncbi:MAG: prolipoprotein diacylglyceryl transferase [Clostridiales bacterium]|nr:prolipoprotein diacylglyceryl transferase [Clostridiales bacterium]